MQLKAVWHLGVKELRSFARDPGMIGLIIFAFSLAIYAAATTIPETLNRAPIAIVDHDRSPLSTRIGAAFYPPMFTEPQVISASEMDQRLDAGRATFALDVPPNFQRDVLAGRRPALQLNVDGTRITQAYAGSGYVQAIVDAETRAFVARYKAISAPPVDLALRARFNPLLDKTWFGAVTEVINNITMLSIVLTGAALIREREHGTIEHLLVMPVTPGEIMISKVWAMGVVVLAAATASLLIVVQGAIGVPIEGSIPLFLVGATLHLFATTSIGIFLATVARSMPQFGLLLMLVLLPMEMLSGGITPRESMPEAVQLVMQIAPTTHFIAMAQAVLFRAAGISVVWPYLLALAVIGTSFFAFALSRFRKTLSAMA